MCGPLKQNISSIAAENLENFALVAYIHCLVKDDYSSIRS